MRRLCHRLSCSSALLWTLAAAAEVAQPPASLMHEVFQDHAVLQRDHPVVIWGDARPGDEVQLTLNGTTAHTSADAAGHWQASLPSLPAGGPYTLEARSTSGAAQRLTDILVGDVYLCSGQSNMELSVASAQNAAGEIAGSANDSLRLLSIARASHPTARAHFAAPVHWAAASPATVPEFSAACYFFARELQKSVRVPVGLIHASWGGSRIEPWISAAGLRRVGGVDDSLDSLELYARDPGSAQRRMGAVWENWWRAHAPPGLTPWKSTAGANWRPVPEPLRDWKTWGVPELANHAGMVWFRRSIKLNARQAAGGASLSLGAIDQIDETWVNGRPIGNSFGYGTERVYRLPAGVLHAGENTIVVNVFSPWGAGGMFGPNDHLKLELDSADHAEVPLAKEWQYQPVPEGMGFPPRAPWDALAGLTDLYNAMIAPLGSFGLRGVLWYQGEANTGEADHYQALLQGMMRDWRSRFGPDLPFLIVELPNFGDPVSAPATSGWASLREAQRRAVAADGHAALAVTIDVGDPHELHPPNKQAVGSRLALAARRLIYGESISASGPVPTAARRSQSNVEVSFDDDDGGLVTYSAKRPMGFELCGAETGSCRFVDALLQSNRVLLDASEVSTARRVRFCWGDAPICNLYDKSGLPAGPFEIDIAP